MIVSMVDKLCPQRWRLHVYRLSLLHQIGLERWRERQGIAVD